MAEAISKMRLERSKKSGAARRPKAGIPPAAAGLGLATWCAALLLLQGLHPSLQKDLAVGQKATATVVSALDFECPDLARTELNRRREADAIPPVFTVNPAPLTEALRDLDKLFDRLSQLKKTARAGDAAAQAREVGNVLDLLGITMPPEDALRVVPATATHDVLEPLKKVLAETWRRGIVSTWEKESGLRGVARGGRILLESSDGRPARIAEIPELLTPEMAADEAVGAAHALPGLAHLPAPCLRALLGAQLAPNLVYEPALTDQRRAEAVERAPVATQTVRAGTTLIESGEPASAQQVEMLRANNQRLRARMSPADQLLAQTGRAGLLAIALLVCLGLLHISAPDVLHDRRRLALFFTLSTLVLGAARGMLWMSVTTRWISPALIDYMLPLAIAPLVGSILVGRRYAMALGLWTSFASAVMVGNSFDLFSLGAISTLAAALAARHARKRSIVFRAGIWIGLAKTVYVLCLAVMLQQSMPIWGAQALSAMGGSIAAALVVLLALPVLEYLFGLTSDIRLLELSDPGHPLLQRLAVEAPGTYHHSLMVANLAQSAADEIGAHALLIRVCAYFHDIGKLTKPDYFTENAQFKRNPHDDLTPNMSTLVIMSHVKEGLGLAKLHRLPPPIVDGIVQHHGTSLIAYFYHRALHLNPDDGVPDGVPPVAEEDFRYAGPRPHSREMAILALADSVEAASRSMEKPTPGRVESLIGEVVARKLADGQLNESALTLADLEKIKKSFVFTLNSMLHGRVAYPKDEARDSQPPEEAPRGLPGRPGADDLADEATEIIERADEVG